MRNLKQSTAANVLVLMTDSVDHITGKAGLTLTITASKDGAAFAAITPAVTDLGSGWYALALASGDTDTLGDLVLHVTATGADPTDALCQVIESVSFPTHFADMAISANGVLKAIPSNSDGTPMPSASTVQIDLGQVLPASPTSGTVGEALKRAENLPPQPAAVGSAMTLAAGVLPVHFASLAITPEGAVTAGTVMDKSGYRLSADGTDAVIIEAGANLRQAITAVFAASAGVVTGASESTITIKGGGVDIDRIVASVDADGNRNTVMLSLPL